MLELIGKKTPTQKRRDKQVRLFACAARVFVEANESTGGIEALVFKDGSCLLPFTVFLELVKSYAPQPNITIEADERTVRFGSTTLSSVQFSPTSSPPAKFQVFPVTDTWLAGAPEERPGAGAVT